MSFMATGEAGRMSLMATEQTPTDWKSSAPAKRESAFTSYIKNFEPSTNVEDRRGERDTMIGSILDRFGRRGEEPTLEYNKKLDRLPMPPSEEVQRRFPGPTDDEIARTQRRGPVSRLMK